MPKKAGEKDKKTQTFEASLQRLEEIVGLLERGEAPLESALMLYEEGVALARFCNKQVEEAERRVMLLEDKNGELRERPFTSGRSQPPAGGAGDDEEDETGDDDDEGEEDSGKESESGDGEPDLFMRRK